METAEKNPKTSTQSQLKKENTEEKNELASNSNSHINTLSNNNANQSKNATNSIEFNKLQGFDVLEKLPPKNFNDTYNQEFYGTLENLKYLSLSVPDEDKLFYHFEQKPTLTEEIRSEIIKMEKRLQTFLVEQKTETIRLLKEIANLQKEKDALKGEIESCFERLNNLEKEIGTNRDYIKTISDVKSVNKGMEMKTKRSNANINMGLNHPENAMGSQENNLITRMTGNTVTNPGEGLSENFEIKTIGANNFS